MFDLLINSIQKTVALSDRDVDKIISVLKVRQGKKKKNLLNEGDPAGMMFYVNEGLFRYYVFDQDGGEHTIELIAENNWFGDAKAFLAQEQAGINIEALED